MAIAEQRKHIRFDAVNPSEVNIYNDDVLLKEGRGKTLNISKGGALIETGFPIEKGQRVALVISIDADFVYISGEIAHTSRKDKDKHRAGVKFVTIDEAGQAILDKYISIFAENKNTAQA